MASKKQPIFNTKVSYKVLGSGTAGVNDGELSQDENSLTIIDSRAGKVVLATPLSDVLLIFTGSSSIQSYELRAAGHKLRLYPEKNLRASPLARCIKSNGGKTRLSYYHMAFQFLVIASVSSLIIIYVFSG